VLKTVGVLLTIVGVGFAWARRCSFQVKRRRMDRELAVLASALCAAVCQRPLYRPYLASTPTLQVSAFAMAASVGFLAWQPASKGLSAHPSTLRQRLAAVLFIGASSAIGYYMWLWALGHGLPDPGHGIPLSQPDHFGRPGGSASG